METRAATELLDSLHQELGRVYGGGDSAGLRSLLRDEVEWHVPGENAIAGSYRGIDQVLKYFLRRRTLAGGTLRLHPGEVLAGPGDHVAVLTDGSAVIGGVQHNWSTIGLYRIRDRRIAACWLLPLDPAAFDRAWSTAASRETAPGPAAGVLILTGAPGVGKTTTARSLAHRYERAVHLESDRFFEFIRSGSLPPWQPEAHEQNTMIMRFVAHAAAGYASHGYVTIIDGIVLPRWFLIPLSDRLQAAGHRVAYAVLRAPLGTCIARSRGRGGNALADPAVIERLWREFADLGPLEAHAIEVGEAGVEEAATLIADRWSEELGIARP